MTGSLLLRGMLIGVLAGVFAFFFAYVFGEPQVDLAIAFEEQTARAEAEAIIAAGGTLPAEEPDLVSRKTQATFGLAAGLLAYGAAIGGLFSLVFAASYGRLGDLRARGTSALLAVAAFVAVVAVPLMKYPANPPAVGSDDTIVARTSLFFILLVVSVLAMAAAFMLAKRLLAERGPWTAATFGAVFYAGVMAATYAAMPSIVEMPDGFSAQVVWDFRVSSFGIHLILWVVIGLGFGVLAERLMEGPSGIRRMARA